jgi:hypothetical protein
VFKIEDHVPVPVRSNGSHLRVRYPFAEMKPGQSFAVPNKATRNSAMRSAATFIRNHPETAFISRAEHDGGYRIWCAAVHTGTQTGTHTGTGTGDSL